MGQGHAFIMSRGGELVIPNIIVNTLDNNTIIVKPTDLQDSEDKTIVGVPDSWTEEHIINADEYGVTDTVSFTNYAILFRKADLFDYFKGDRQTLVLLFRSHTGSYDGFASVSYDPMLDRLYSYSGVVVAGNDPGFELEWSNAWKSSTNYIAIRSNGGYTTDSYGDAHPFDGNPVVCEWELVKCLVCRDL